jgi:DMSO/TMAO reductase YedYZ molybdopterin-dependent catalytic subunit
MVGADITPRKHRSRIKRGRILSLILGLLSMGLNACQSAVSEQQLDQWRKEAVAENDRLTQAQAFNRGKDWKVTIEGEVERPITLDWPAIERLATQALTTHNPYADNPKIASKYRGIPLKTLFDRAGIKVGAKEITVIAADAYYASMPLSKAIADQGLLAISENGKPIPRSNGGPVYMVYATPPQAPNITDSQAWAYYTTHIIVGSEPLQLKVGNKIFNRFDIEKLPTTTVTTLVGYKIGWSSTPVKLTGVKLKTLLRHQRLTIPPQSIVKVRRKAMTPNEPQKSVELSPDLIDRCDVILAYRWGNDAQNIPGQKGGPLTLAYGPNCTSADAKDLAWLPFVESISIEPISLEPPAAKS